MVTTSVSTTYTVVETITATGCTNTNSVKVTVNPLPAAFAGADRTICPNTSTSIGAAPVTGSTYSWSSVPAGFTSTVANPTVTPLVNTVYTVVETVTATGCTKSNSVKVTVNPIPAAVAGADKAICLNSGTTIGAASITGNTYRWSSSPEGFSTTSANATVNPLVTTTYTVVETISATGCSNTNSVKVTVNPLPAAVAGADRAICINASTTLGAAPVTGSTYSWSSSPVGFTSTTANPLVSPLVTTTYTVIATITATGCTNSGSVKVTVNPLPIPTIIGSATLCVGSMGLDYYTEPAMTGYTWTVSAGGVITSGAATNAITVSWNTSGPQTVSVNYTNGNGCTATSATIKNVTVSPATGNAGIITGTTVICSGTQNVAYSTVAIANATTYLWTLPSGATIGSGTGTPSIVVSYAENAASGNISVYGSNACNSGTATNLAIAVTPQVHAAGIITGPIKLASGTTGAVYSVAPITNATNYTWTMPIGATIATGANTNSIGVNFGPSAATGVITVSGSNSCERGAESSILVQLENTPEIDLGIYPVPNLGVFTVAISFPEETTFNIRVYDKWSQTVLEIKDARTSSGYYAKLIDMGNVSTGVYYVEIFNNTYREVRKILIRK